MKYIAATYLAFAALLPMNAQTEISGRLITPDKHIPEAVNIMVYNMAKTQMHAFDISDDQGNFKISFQANADSICIATRAMAYADTVHIVANKNQNFDIHLRPQQFNLREVNIKGSAIHVRGDTTSYVVESFKRTSDQSIGDVISRMPGFSTSPDGKLQFMGQQIEKYYIEGMDLLGSRYMLANQNLAHRDVASVQVLHNHQPVKMLRQMKHHSGTSVNIKLKKKFTTTFRTDLESGLPVAKYGYNATSMIFTPKNQMLASLQGNNLGNNISFSHLGGINTSNEIASSSNQKNNHLSVPLLTPAMLTQSHRYLNNRSNLASFNYLSKLTADSELKINLSYWNDRLRESADYTTKYYIDGDTTTLYEQNKSTRYEQSLVTDVIFEENSDRKFFNNQLRIQKFWDHGLLQVQPTQNQSVNNPHFSVADELIWHKKAGKHMVSTYAYIDYNHTPQEITLNPGVFSNYVNEGEPHKQTTQNYTTRDLTTKLNAAFTFNSARWAFDTQLSATYMLNSLQTQIKTELGTVDADSLRNQLHWSEARLSVSEQIRFETPGVKLKIEFPLSLWMVHLNDGYHQNDQSGLKPIFAPQFVAEVPLAMLWQLKSDIQFARTTGDVNSLTRGYIITGYRTMGRGTTLLSNENKIRASAALHYKNPVAGWFAVFQYNIQKNNNNLITSQNSLGNGVFQTEAIEKHNNRLYQNASTEITYFASTLKSSVTVTGQYSHKKSEYLLEEQLKPDQSNLARAGFVFDFGFWTKLKINYSGNFQRMEQLQTNRTYKEQQQQISLFIYPMLRHWLNIKAEYIQTRSMGQFTQGYFGDVSYSFRPIKGKFSYRFSVRNLFDHRRLTTFAQNDYMWMQNTYQLRPREFLVSIQYGL